MEGATIFVISVHLFASSMSKQQEQPNIIMWLK